MLLLCCVFSFSKLVLPVELEICSDARNADQSLDTDSIQTVSLLPTSQTVSLPPTSHTTSLSSFWLVASSSCHTRINLRMRLVGLEQRFSQQVRQSADKSDSQPTSQTVSQQVRQSASLHPIHNTVAHQEKVEKRY